MSKRECLKRVQHQPPNMLFVLGKNAENIRNGQKINTVSVLSSPTTSTYDSKRHHSQVESIQRLASQGTIKPATEVISPQKENEFVKPSNIAPNSSSTSKLSTFDTVSCPPPPVFFAVDKRINPNVLVDWKKLPPRWTGKKPAWQVFCTKLITKLCLKNNSLTPYFKEPVDPIKLGIPDYLEKVETPMDLATIRKKITHKQYVHPDEFVKDIRLIIDNILIYYEDGSAMQMQAKRFEAMFNASWNEFPGIDAPGATEKKPKQRKPRETVKKEALQVVNESMTIAQKRQKVLNYLSTFPSKECRPILRIIQMEEHYNGKNVTTLRSLCQKEVDLGNASHSMIFSLFEYLDAFQTDKNRAKQLGEENEATAEMFGFTAYDDELGPIDQRDLKPFPTEKFCRVQNSKDDLEFNMSESSESDSSSDSDSDSDSDSEDKSSKLCTVECSSAGILGSNGTLASKEMLKLSDSPRSTSDSSSGVFKKPYPPGHQKMKQLNPSPDKFKPPTSIENSSNGSLKRRAQESSSFSSNLDGQKSDIEPVCKKRAPPNKNIERIPQLAPASVDLPQKATTAAPQLKPTVVASKPKLASSTDHGHKMDKPSHMTTQDKPLSPMKLRSGRRTSSSSFTSSLN